MSNVLLAVLALLVLAPDLYLPAVQAHEGDDHEVAFNKIAMELPVALSDMTATYIPNFKGEEGMEAIILVGGCADGNYDDTTLDAVTGKNVTNYYCMTISAETYVFYPSTLKVVKLQNMPSARYRHSAAFVNDKLYIIGGRTLVDEVVKDIIEYDPVKDTWSNFMPLEAKYAPSDQASFGRDGSIYILGGYYENYDTRDNFFSINIETKQILDLKPMNTKRGDAQAAYYHQKDIEAVYIMGGFTKETTKEFCEPLNDAEKYDFDTNTWTEIEPLKNQRGDKGVVVLNNKILAIGGEDKHESLCSGGSDVEASSHAIVVDDVESYNPLDGDEATWEVESDFIEFRFRTASAVSEQKQTVYIFGGQLAYDPACKCYKTSKDIFSYRDTHDDSGTSCKKMAFVITIFVAFITALMI